MSDVCHFCAGECSASIASMICRATAAAGKCFQCSPMADFSAPTLCTLVIPFSPAMDGISLLARQAAHVDDRRAGLTGGFNSGTGARGMLRLAIEPSLMLIALFDCA